MCPDPAPAVPTPEGAPAEAAGARAAGPGLEILVFRMLDYLDG